MRDCSIVLGAYGEILCPIAELQRKSIGSIGPRRFVSSVCFLWSGWAARSPSSSIELAGHGLMTFTLRLVFFAWHSPYFSLDERFPATQHMRSFLVEFAYQPPRRQ
jgi:hypothetical protein